MVSDRLRYRLKSSATGRAPARVAHDAQIDDAAASSLGQEEPDPDRRIRLRHSAARRRSRHMGCRRRRAHARASTTSTWPTAEPRRGFDGQSGPDRPYTCAFGWRTSWFVATLDRANEPAPSALGWETMRSGEAPAMQRHPGIGSSHKSLHCVILAFILTGL
jgi:hypothetical protein